MQTLYVFVCVPLCRGGISCGIRGYPKNENGAQRDELKNGCGRVWVVPSLHPQTRVFLNRMFREPAVCTPACCGFRHFRSFRDSANLALDSLLVAV